MISITLWIATILLGIGLLCSFVRLIRGPDLIDSIAAADAILLIFAGIVFVIAVKFKEPAYIQSALALAVFAFLGNMVFAKIISPSSVGEEDDDE